MIYFQTGLRARDDEIRRLGSQLGLGPDPDALAAQMRAEASEAIILALTQQVGRGGACSSDSSCPLVLPPGGREPADGVLHWLHAWLACLRVPKNVSKNILFAATHPRRWTR